MPSLVHKFGIKYKSQKCGVLVPNGDCIWQVVKETFQMYYTAIPELRVALTFLGLFTILNSTDS